MAKRVLIFGADLACATAVCQDSSARRWRHGGVTDNWWAAGIRGLSLSVTNTKGEYKAVNFEIEVGVPYRLHNGMLLHRHIAIKAAAEAANLTAIEMGGLAYITNGKFYNAEALVGITFAKRMEVKFNRILRDDYFGFNKSMKIGARVSSKINSPISPKAAEWGPWPWYEKLGLIFRRGW